MEIFSDKGEGKKERKATKELEKQRKREFQSDASAVRCPSLSTSRPKKRLTHWPPYPLAVFEIGVKIGSGQRGVSLWMLSNSLLLATPVFGLSWSLGRNGQFISDRMDGEKAGGEGERLNFEEEERGRERGRNLNLTRITEREL